MAVKKIKKKKLFPFDLTSEVTVRGVNDMRRAVIEESDRQVVAKSLKSEEAEEEFRMACDALNCGRLLLRLEEELGGKLDPEATKSFERLIVDVSKVREYPLDDFRSALQATHDRVRLPWGYNPLRLAYVRSQRRPIRLLKKGLRDSELLAKIVGIAVELTTTQKKGQPILLPVDNVRELLAQRKLVVGGAIQRLIQAELLIQTSKRYGNGKARLFQFNGKEGVDFEYVDEDQEN